MVKISRIISHKNKFSTAFTLIELLVVISIIGLLSSVVIASVTAARKQGMIAAGQKFDAHTHAAFYDDLVLSWDFDRDTAGSGIVQDLSGNGNNLSLTGATLDGPPTPNPFKTGKVISIGPSKTANLPAPMKKPPAGKFSVSFWLYPVLAAGETAEATEYLSYFPLSSTKGNTWKFSYAVGAAGFNFKYIPLLPTNQRTVSIGQLAFNTWHHIVAVCNTTNNKIGVYVNGKSVGTPTGVTDCGFNNTDLTVGLRLVSVGKPYYLDNVRIYGESLPLSFIQEQYLAGKPKFEALAKNMKDQKN